MTAINKQTPTFGGDGDDDEAYTMRKSSRMNALFTDDVVMGYATPNTKFPDEWK